MNIKRRKDFLLFSILSLIYVFSFVFVLSNLTRDEDEKRNSLLLLFDRSLLKNDKQVFLRQ